MDSSLRKKIVKHIADGISEYRPEGKPIEEIADKILKSVADEGYVLLTTYNVPKGGWKKDGVVLEPGGPYLFDRGPKKMTGQEWYDRFEKKLKYDNGDDIVTALDRDYLRVAKKAAGIK